MKALQDTHTALFMWGEPSRLSPTVRASLETAEHQFVFSQISTWEICLKYRTGKLPLAGESPGTYLRKRIRQSEFIYEPIADAALFRTVELPPHHHDPFDRLLIATALALGIPILTADESFRRFPVDVLW